MNLSLHEIFDPFASASAFVEAGYHEADNDLKGFPWGFKDRYLHKDPTRGLDAQAQASTQQNNKRSRKKRRSRRIESKIKDKAGTTTKSSIKPRIRIETRLHIQIRSCQAIS